MVFEIGNGTIIRVDMKLTYCKEDFNSDSDFSLRRKSVGIATVHNNQYVIAIEDWFVGFNKEDIFDPYYFVFAIHTESGVKKLALYSAMSFGEKKKCFEELGNIVGLPGEELIHVAYVAWSETMKIEE